MFTQSAPPTTIVMTGGTSGIGLRAVQKLMLDQRIDRIFLIARASEQLQSVQSRYDGSKRLSIVLADLADLASVASACNAILDALAGKTIDAMALNAGLQAVGEAQSSADGLEIAFAVNYLANVLIVERLKDHMTSGGRIVITASEVHDPDAFCLVGITRAEWQDPRDLADPTVSQMQVEALLERGEARYSASKLLAIMHVRYLARHLPGVVATAFNPSVVPGTEIARERAWWARGGWKFIMPALTAVVPGMRSIERSASDLVWLVREAPADLIAGQYVNGRTIEPGSAESREWAKIDRSMDVGLDLLANLGHLPPAPGGASAAEACSA